MEIFSNFLQTIKKNVIEKTVFNKSFYFCCFIFLINQNLYNYVENKRAFLYPAFFILSNIFVAETSFLRLQVTNNPVQACWAFSNHIPGFKSVQEISAFVFFIENLTPEPSTISGDLFSKKDMENPFYQKTIAFLEYYLKLELIAAFLKYLNNVNSTYFFFSFLFL